MLSLFNIRILLFEKNKHLGKKLSATGNGRCNIHNTNTNATQFQSDTFTQKEIQNILNAFSYNDFLKFCKKIGLMLEAKEDGRVYPLSNSAKSVLSIFNTYLQKAQNLQIFLESEIIHITQNSNGFLLRNAHSLIPCDTLILACGSEASPKLGGSQKGLHLAQLLHLQIMPTYPSLCPLKVTSAMLKSLSGIKIKAKLTLKNAHKTIAQIYDDVLFTSYGISGFAVLDISPYLKGQKDFNLFLDFLPSLEQKELFGLFSNCIKNHKNISLESLLCGFLHPKIAKAFATHFSLNPNNTKHLQHLSFLLKNFALEYPILHGFENAEVCGGGISAKEINTQTMESKRIKNLYIIGEILDIIGNRGGYNLAFAWSSAFICANAIKLQQH